MYIKGAIRSVRSRLKSVGVSRTRLVQSCVHNTWIINLSVILVQQWSKQYYRDTVPSCLMFKSQQIKYSKKS